MNAIQIKHESFQLAKVDNGHKYSYTLQGNGMDIDNWFNAYRIGAQDPYNAGATIESAVIKSVPGNGWMELEVSSLIRQDSNGNLVPGMNPGPIEHSIAIRTMELPLETCRQDYFGATYRTKWNWMLIGIKGSAIPAWWETATDVLIPATTTSGNPQPDDLTYRWVKDPNDRPPDSSAGKWVILLDKKKPGQESFYFPSVEITERGYHADAADATWIIKHAAMRRSPALGTFGITAGEWLCMGGTAERNNNIWVATCTYLWSPTKWDHDFYGTN